MEYMKAIAVMGPNDIRVVDDVPKPVLGDYEALVKVHACGFCNGTDMQIITGTGGDLGNSVSIYPTVLGHEGAGEVVAVAKRSATSTWESGGSIPISTRMLATDTPRPTAAWRSTAWSATTRPCWRTVLRRRTSPGSSSINSLIP